MTKYQIAAIIGYWRCGVTLEEMSLATDFSTVVIEGVIRNYFKTIG